MNLRVLEKRSEWLLLPFAVIFLWLRLASVIQASPVLLVLSVVVFLLTAVLLYKVLTRFSRSLMIGLWLIISVLMSIDSVQHSIYAAYSESRFQKDIESSSSEISRRAETAILQGRSAASNLSQGLQTLLPETGDSLFVRLQERFGSSSFWWAIYDGNGQLLAWRGQYDKRESLLESGVEEISVISELHQQFLKLKRTISFRGRPLMIVVLRPIGADYGIQNRYLRTYNLLTDGLPLRPLLLYSSRTSTSAKDLIIRNIQVTEDFSISAVYQKSQYFDLFRANEQRLHWWFECLLLVFCLIAAVYLFFGFAARATRDSASNRSRALLTSWIVLAAACAFSIDSVRHFYFFGMVSGDLILSPANLVSVAFFILISVSSLGALVGLLHWGIPSQSSVVHSLILLPCFVLLVFGLQSYSLLIRDTLSGYPFDLTDFSFRLFSLSKIAIQTAWVWLDLSAVFLVGIVMALLFARLPRTRAELIRVVALQSASAALTLYLWRRETLVPFAPVILLLTGIVVTVFYFPAIRGYFSRVNFLSRFLVLAAFLFLCGGTFYFIRFHDVCEIRRGLIRDSAAPQVVGQEDWTRRMLQASERQLDMAMRTISMDPAIPDLAYRLWSRTDLAVNGWKSSVEIYNGNGNPINRFSLNLPSLTVNVPQLAGDQHWSNRQGVASLGNLRKSTQYGVRVLPGIGYLVVQVIQDYENLPFVTPSSPFQELFRSYTEPGLPSESTTLTVYDVSWHPVFISSPEFTPSVPRGRELLRDVSAVWDEEDIGGRKCEIYYFRLPHGYAALVTARPMLRSQIVRLIDLLVFNVLWLLALSLPLRLALRKTVLTHLPPGAPVRFSFFQKLLFAFVIFTMIPMVSLSLLMRNYAWEQETKDVTSRSLTSFSVASVVVADYLMLNRQNPETEEKITFSDGILEWIGEAIAQDVSLYYDRALAATSRREFFQAGLLGERIPGNAYVDLFLEGRKYSISEGQIGTLKFLNVSGRLENTPGYGDEVISIPFMIDQNRVEAEILELREYTVLVGAALILTAVFLGFFLASRISRPVQTLIYGTGEMARGNLGYRIREEYQDEFKQLVASFNSMAGSLHEQQEALERRRAYIENIVNNITTSVVSIDSTMNITKLNPEAAKRFGIESAFDGPFEQLLSRSPGLGEVGAAFRLFLQDREQFQVKEVAGPDTGPDSTWRLVYVPLFEEKRWNGAVFLAEDVTDIIRSNRLSAWAEMARRVAHDVKNPLTPIQLAIEHVVRVYQDHSPEFESVLLNSRDVILKQVKTLRTRVSEFSQYGRPTGLHRSDVDLARFLTDLAASYSGHLPENIEMKTTLDPELPVLRIDSEKIKGSLMNILENGLQAMKSGGRLSLEATNGSDQFVTIRISDTGQGVPPEILPRLFEPYFSTKSGGTGLGLAIARQNIEDHGGKIQVESRLHHGTTVTILLPRA
jgi:signal transduction histidine kinase